MRLQDKVAIIVGASGGMGQETVKRFLEEGAMVVAADLNVEKLQDPGKDHFLRVKTDITVPEQVGDLIDQTLQRFGRVDALVNIAGIAQAATPIEEVSEQDWDRIMAINTKSIFLTSRAVVPAMKKQVGGGVIVNVASIAAVRPRPGLNAYIASKGATLAFTQALAIELAENKIRVNAVNPGPADTQMLGKFTAEGANAEDTRNAIFKDSVPLGELIQPQDIANAIVYLSSDEARMVTGSIFNIDGGRGI
ncbi:3-oxoacyl-[acyl-carrier protein] reductase [Scopulibacillus darangshiensis]|uniref:3-oxoacyl-[acyl-carrier protein] reductase n=1 Tax=Scopulibacillus darangshiensis TaxID=442528 RepID=A0A4R2P228_9BACL|nr:SDR family oxidoreductase [Scopulibacillus darangshiensis]TCP28769.1 3-oxoacyl-[acyl-carrier protein] reductase [Scopulibacillus darangshiensis]